MEFLGEVIQWFQTTIVSLVELLPFVDNGQDLVEKATSWFLVGGIGGAASTVPLYQALVARYTIRHAKRIVRRILRVIIGIMVIALTLKLLGL